jgi:predicted Zn-dependent peptidase
VFREFYKERDVVYEERRMRVESSPVGRLYYEFITTAFHAHPYGFGGIGYPSDLKTFSRPQGEAYFKRNYVAKNLTIAVVGDVTLDQVKQLATKYFSAVSDAPAPPPVDTVEPKQIGERRVTIEDKAQPIILVGWHIPAVSDPSYAAWKAAADLLGGGRWSRLYKTLVKEKKIAVQVGCSTGEPGEKYPNLMMMYIVPASGQDPGAVEQAAYDVIADAMGGKPFTNEELDGSKVRVRAQKIGSAEDNGELAGELAQAQALYGGWREFFREQERVQTLTPDDLTAVMREGLVKSNRTVATIVNPPAGGESKGGR